MNLQLNREFSTDVGGPDEDTWSGYHSAREKGPTWDTLKERSVVVVLGEAGVGKTTEFQNRVAQLRQVGVFALFVPLNAIIDANHWALFPSDVKFLNEWEKSGKLGYFFLDAIDESRLINPAAFRNALGYVHEKLQPHLKCARFVLSSRHSDWAVPTVQDAVHEFLTSPSYIAALSREEVDAVLERSTAMVAPRTEPVLLKPLSKEDRERLARHFGVKSEASFWANVKDGDYLEMAVRPRDLKWLVGYWNSNERLGSYLELMQEHVRNRLSEHNDTYKSAASVLAMSDMDRCAEELAAAAEMSGKAFFSLSEPPQVNELSAQRILAKLKPVEVDYLLKSAVFDLATYQRVQFNHRSIREFLAGRWVVHKFRAGVPFELLCGLFYSNAYGKDLLIPSRRYSLCWACALDANFRQWAAAKFPEVYVFDGDPGAWDSPTAEQAFAGYIRIIASGRHKDWMNSASEIKRAIQPFRPGFLCNLIAEYSQSEAACVTLLQYVIRGEVLDCVDAVKDIYESAPHSSYRFQTAVGAVGVLGNLQLKQSLKNALANRVFEGNNRLILEAVEALGLHAFKAAELICVFQQTAPLTGQSGYELSHPFVRFVELQTDVEVVRNVLQAIFMMVPVLDESVRFGGDVEGTVRSLVWLYEVMGPCLERMLTLLPPAEEVDDVVIAAVEKIDWIRHSRLAGNDVIARIEKLIEMRPMLRWRLVELIAAADAGKNINRLGYGSIVTLHASDVEEVTRRANDTTQTSQYRAMWFSVATSVVFRTLVRRERREASAKLVVAEEADSRQSSIDQAVRTFAKAACSNRIFKNEERVRQREMKISEKLDVELMTAELGGVVAGNSDAVLKMAHFVFSRMRITFFEQLDFSKLAQKFSPDISESLYSGLKIYFEKLEIPNPSDFEGGAVPWSVLLAATFALEQAARGGWSVSAPVGKLARLDVWFPNGPSDLFKSTYVGHETEVVESLSEWVIAEAKTADAGIGVHSAIKFAMRLSPLVKVPLLRVLKAMPFSDSYEHPTSRLGLFDEIVEAGELAIEEQAAISRAEATRLIIDDELLRDFSWYRRWLLSEPEAAWDWFLKHLLRVGERKDQQARLFAENFGGLKASYAFDGEVYSDILTQVYRLLKPLSKPLGEIEPFEREPVSAMTGSIPNLLRSVSGEGANRALAEFAAMESDTAVRAWLLSQQRDHAAADAQDVAVMEPEALQALIEGFEADPASESALLKQVLARLKEIRIGVEQGPFSDRCLFKPNMKEKEIQLWLAARLAERNPMRRFSVQREEEVDDDKKTDIQLSMKSFTVCVEIKPLDADRYSAEELVSTLREQIVGQYLKGHNSAHGVLVLFRLSERRWKVPGHHGLQPFECLMAYLNAEADRIREEHNAKSSRPIESLIIFDFCCYLP